MDNKELGYLFRLALSCALDSTKSIRLGEPDTVMHNVITIALNHIDLIPTEDLMRMYTMIYSYLLMEEIKKRTDGNTDDKGTSHRSE